MSDTTEKDLEDMGLVQTSPGVWVPKKTAEKVEKIRAVENKKVQAGPREVSIDGPPTFYVIRGVKHYLTANAFLYQKHWTVRSKIMKYAKAFLKDYMQQLEPLKAHTTLMVTFSVKKKITPLMDFDVDNRGYFWGKVFQDVLQDMKLVPNDNAHWISKVYYEFDWKRKEDNLTFKIL